MSSNRVGKLLSSPHIFLYFTAVNHEVTSTVKITPLWLLFWCLRQGQYQIGQFADYSSSGVHGDIFYPHCLSHSSRNPIVTYVTHMHIYPHSYRHINQLMILVWCDLSICIYLILWNIILKLFILHILQEREGCYHGILNCLLCSMLLIPAAIYKAVASYSGQC